MLHTSLAASADVLSSVVAFAMLKSIIGKKRGTVKGKPQIAHTVTAHTVTAHCRDSAISPGKKTQLKKWGEATQGLG
jgi:hypothetical protein